MPHAEHVGHGRRDVGRGLPRRRQGGLELLQGAQQVDRQTLAAQPAGAVGQHERGGAAARSANSPARKPGIEPVCPSRTPLPPGREPEAEAVAAGHRPGEAARLRGRHLVERGVGEHLARRRRPGTPRSARGPRPCSRPDRRVPSPRRRAPAPRRGSRRSGARCSPARPAAPAGSWCGSSRAGRAPAPGPPRTTAFRSAVRRPRRAGRRRCWCSGRWLRPERPGVRRRGARRARRTSRPGCAPTTRRRARSACPRSATAASGWCGRRSPRRAGAGRAGR